MTRDMLATWWGPADRPGGVTTRLWLPGVVFDAGHLPGGPDLVQVEDFTVEMHASLQRLCGCAARPGTATRSGPNPGRPRCWTDCPEPQR